MKLWTFTTTHTDGPETTSDVILSLKVVKDNLKGWLADKIKSTGKKNIKSISTAVVSDTGVAGLNGSDDGLVQAIKEFDLSEQKDAIKTVLDAVKTADTVGLLIETTGGDFLSAQVTAFDIDNKKLPKKFIVQGAEYNEPNGTLVPFAVTKDTFYAACKWIVNDFNRAAKAADRPDRINLKDVMQTKGATSPASWGTNSWIKYTIVKEK